MIRSVRGRVTLLAGAVLAVAVAVGSAALVQAERSTLLEGLEESAEQRAEDVALVLASGGLPDGAVVADDDDVVVRVVDSSGRIVASSTEVEDDDEGAAASVVSVAGTLDGEPVTVQVAVSAEDIDEAAAALTSSLVVAAPLLVAITTLLIWVVVGRALRPVEAIRAEVEVIGAEDLSRRVPEPATGDEVGRLSRTMNAMLERLQQSVERQQRFVADASHELRSPLTAMMTELEVGVAQPDRTDWRRVASDLLGDAARMQRLIDDLLVLARADSGVGARPRRLVDLDDVALAECARARTSTSLSIDTSGVSGGQVLGSAEDLGRVVRNLLDNALRHASSSVAVGLVESAAGVTLTVDDDGAGIPVDDRTRIFERFARSEDARDRVTGGTGLGLAICADLVAAHGGSVVAGQSPQGGARISVTLPTPIG